MDDILQDIERGNWTSALEKYSKLMERGNLTVDECIAGASIFSHFEQWEAMRDLLYRGLYLDPQNYELYLMLGDLLSRTNPDQAYLTYENALYYAIRRNNDEDALFISDVLAKYKEDNRITVRNTSFIILSYNTKEYTAQCIQSIRNTCFDKCYEIVVVDNASTDGSLEWLSGQPDIVLVQNERNYGFPAGCNMGVAAASPDNDIFLLNSDTMMMSNSLYMLRMGLYEDDRHGACGAVTNFAENGQVEYQEGDQLADYIAFSLKNNIPIRRPYEYKIMLIMFAMLISRKVYDEVGGLDERFSPGNFEDDDYGIRILKAGYKNVLCHNAYIIHFGNKSFDNSKDLDYQGLMETNRGKFIKKWGFDPQYYMLARNEIINMITADKQASIRVLEIGCGLGETIASIQYRYPNSSVRGIEVVQSIAELGNKRLDIVCGDIEKLNIPDSEIYDYIIMADVIEHLVHPEEALLSMRKHLADGGYILASIPNLMNAVVIYELLHGNFTYQDAGILDHSHLRFFTKNEIYRLFTKTGYEVDHIGATLEPEESTDSYKEFFDGITALVGRDMKVQFDVYQYLVRARISG